MKMVGILQNAWFKPGVNPRHVEMYHENQDFHRRVLAMSKTGEHLRRAFGDLYDAIHWDNASREHGDTRSFMAKPDPAHVARLLLSMRPDVVMLFGVQAQKAFELAVRDHLEVPRDMPRYVLRGPHPMARGNVFGEVRRVAEELETLLKAARRHGER